MSGPPCGELNDYLSEKYAAIRAAEAKAKAGAEAVPSDAELTKALRASGEVLATISYCDCFKALNRVCYLCQDDF